MALSAPPRRGSFLNLSVAFRSRKITTTLRSNDCLEHASPAGALDEVREKARQIREIGTHIRKNAFAGANTIAQKPAASIHFRSPFWSVRSCHRGKNEARATDFFQSRNFCAALKNKVQIFACRFFSAFLISRRWQRARESSGVNKV